MSLSVKSASSQIAHTGVKRRVVSESSTSSRYSIYDVPCAVVQKVVLSFLDHTDLCAFQTTSRNGNILGADVKLWKTLACRRFCLLSETIEKESQMWVEQRLSPAQIFKQIHAKKESEISLILGGIEFIALTKPSIQIPKQSIENASKTLKITWKGNEIVFTNKEGQFPKRLSFTIVDVALDGEDGVHILSKHGDIYFCKNTTSKLDVVHRGLYRHTLHASLKVYPSFYLVVDSDAVKKSRHYIPPRGKPFVKVVQRNRGLYFNAGNFLQIYTSYFNHDCPMSVVTEKKNFQLSYNFNVGNGEIFFGLKRTKNFFLLENTGKKSHKILLYL